ncbi:MAG: S9 family peptidase [Bacteroidales bacterium]|nr:S9 family peptidase [Bacteroidales bacterium]
MRHLMMGVLVCLSAFAGASRTHAQGTLADYDRAARLGERTAGTVIQNRVDPHWTADGNHFWYTNTVPGQPAEYVLVDAVQGTRSVVSQKELPQTPQDTPQPKREPSQPPPRPAEQSPDGKWSAFIRDHDVWIRPLPRGPERRLSWEGAEADRYTGSFFWSPDSTRLIAIRRRAGGNRQLTLVESSPRDQTQPRVRAIPYLKPGDPIPQPRPHLFDVAAGREIPVDSQLFPNPWDCTHYHWSADSSRFFFVYNQRGHGVVRVIAIQAQDGQATAIVNEECSTFFDYANKLFVHHLEATDELLWMSERSGWNHLYRIDRKTGKVRNPVTTGTWVVRGVDRVDAAAGIVEFRACGIDPDQDPYQIHYARVHLDGTGLTRLTTADGTHTIRYSPDRRFFIDTYSRVDWPPVQELRRTADGSRVCGLETADVTALRKVLPHAPERFVTKGRDRKTDIWGLIIRPSQFDPQKKYPVIEHIYAGPHGQHVPKSFRALPYEQGLAELGFIVVRCDGMGTNWRSKAFHDVCWKNLGDSGFPDRLAWIRAAAVKYQQFDLSRGVGIYGGSAGGQSTVRGMTEYPDFYTVGVADCGCHDNRMDKVWWNELWMGWPVGPHYAAQSNVTNAHKLRGKLLLVVGELDTNVDPASTLQVADALIRADRDFDFLLIPGAGHGAAESAYGRRRRADFFVRHLLGREPRSTPNPASR